MKQFEILNDYASYLDGNTERPNFSNKDVRMALDFIVELASQNIGELKRTSLQSIIDNCESLFRIPKGSIKSKSQKRQISDARFCYFYIAIKFTSYSKSFIGKFVNRHHATVAHGYKEFYMLKSHDKRIKSLYDLITVFY
jgi:chromosomal replication initiation ATPase DnaA